MADITSLCTFSGGARKPSVENVTWASRIVTVPASAFPGTTVQDVYVHELPRGVAMVGGMLQMLDETNSGTSCTAGLVAAAYNLETETYYKGGAAFSVDCLAGYGRSGGSVSESVQFSGTYQKPYSGDPSPPGYSAGDKWARPYVGAAGFEITPAGDDATEDMRLLFVGCYARIQYGD